MEDAGVEPVDQYIMEAHTLVRQVRPEPEGSRDRERVEALQTTQHWLENKARGVLEKREDGERQLDHLRAVEKNSRLIYQDLIGRNLTEYEELKISLFTWGHDIGKWAGQEVVEDYSEELVDKMELSPAEKSILDKGVEAVGLQDKDKFNFHRQDIAHHLFSGYLFELYAEKEEAFSKLNDQDRQDVLEGILGHQFNTYYSHRAIDEGYSRKEVGAIKRSQRLETELIQAGAPALDSAMERALGEEAYEQATNLLKQVHQIEANTYAQTDEGALLAAAVHDGDLLSMCQLGEIDKDDKFHLGGYAKLVGIKAMFAMRGIDPSVYTLEECFSSARRSVSGVRREINTPMAYRMFGKWRDSVKLLRGLVLEDKEFEGYMAGKNDISTEERLQIVNNVRYIEDFGIAGKEEQANDEFIARMNQLERVLRQYAKAIVTHKSELATENGNGYQPDWGDVGM